MNILITSNIKNKYKFKIFPDNNIIINVNQMSNMELKKYINKLENIKKIYDDIKIINVVFHNNMDNEMKNMSILSLLHNIYYEYYTKKVKINLLNVQKNLTYYMDEMVLYKDIVMHPNKTTDIYLNYIIHNTPNTYDNKIFLLKPNDMFPLTYAVNKGSKHNSYFVHIFPKNNNIQYKNIYLVGKAVVYDSGGMNLKDNSMKDMKIDMTGSAMLLSVLKLLHNNKVDNDLNIHLLFPIVENLIGSTATKPGTVVKSMSNKTVEIDNTDAEGRLCIVDAIDYVNLYLINLEHKNLIIDVATLTGNTFSITSGHSCISMSNKAGFKFINKLISIGEELCEYVDYLYLRDEYLKVLDSNVADIKSININNKSGCVLAGTFISYFCNKTIPWIHLDVASVVYDDEKTKCFGVNLLYYFLLYVKFNL